LALGGGHGLGEAVHLDLGAIRDFDYYTGVIFEGYGPDLGRPLAQGGRYDGLLGLFGRPAPATGFVIQLDLVGEVLARSGRAPALPRLDAAVGWSRQGLEQAITIGDRLRLFGMRAVVDTEARSLAAARDWRRVVGAVHLVHCPGSGPVHLVPGEGRRRRLSAEQVVARLAASPR
jgi:ATP phosphoribosyltransferase regulatory subunit